jgi:hypothetical protein
MEKNQNLKYGLIVSVRLHKSQLEKINEIAKLNIFQSQSGIIRWCINTADVDALIEKGVY